jgi:hypothetical protein
MTFTTEELFVVIFRGEWSSGSIHTVHDSKEEAYRESDKMADEALKAGGRIVYRVTTLDAYIMDYGRDREDIGRFHAGD